MVRLVNRHAAFLLVAGAVTALLMILFFVFLSVLVPSLHVTLIARPLLIPLILLASVIWFPFAVWLNPWLFAVDWSVSQDEIVYSLPSPINAPRISRSMPTGSFIFLIRGYFGLIAVKQNGDRFRLPVYLWTPDSGQRRKLKAVLVDGRVGYHFV